MSEQKSGDPDPDGTVTEESLQCYVETLNRSELSAYQEYDRALLALSGGGLGLSLAFLEKLQGGGLSDGDGFTWCLFGAWACWAFSLAFLLVDLAFGKLAHKRARRDAEVLQISSDTKKRSAATKRLQAGAGGAWSIWGERLSFVAGGLFIVGLVLILAFAGSNLGRESMHDGDNTGSSAPPSDPHEQKGLKPGNLVTRPAPPLPPPPDPAGKK